MKLGFATLGCAGEPLENVIRLAQEHGFTGLELRAADDEFTRISLTSQERRELRTRIEDAGLTVLAVNSYVHLCGIEEQPLDQHLELAADLGAHGVRVFLRDDDGVDHESPTPGELRAMDRVVSAPREVHILLETHDTHSSGRRLAAFCQLLDQAVPGHNAKVIWDAAHTWRTGETAAESLALLEPWLAFLQIKDGDSQRDFQPVPLGSGDYPIADLMTALAGREYWLSLEWERKWHPDLPPLTEALAATRGWLDGKN